MILEEIVAASRRELEVAKRNQPLVELKRLAREQAPALDLASALRGTGMKFIAEIKKASPSRGVMCADFDPVRYARVYAENGAAAISILTESAYFQGSLNHLKAVKAALGGRRLPLLRKDFIFDPYQIYQSRAYGADALLLIVAILAPEELRALLQLSHKLGMCCLVEVHNEAEVEIALKSNARIIGINNRDLSTFKVDLAATEWLMPLIPADRIVVSESGIKSRDDVERLEELGVNAVLIGEALMSAPDVAARIKELF